MAQYAKEQAHYVGTDLFIYLFIFSAQIRFKQSEES